MGTLDKYPEYKESGVEWIGEIPKHWKLNRLGSMFLERKQKVSDKDFEPLSVTKNGVVPQLDNAAKTNDGDNRKLVKKGDFVINSRSDRKGSSGVSPLDGSVSLINIVLEPSDIDTAFCNYLLKSNGFIEEYYRNGHGIVADLWTTRYWDMKSIMLGIPPPNEQTAIASFLDDKTAQIDQAIRQKEKMIELLGERRQILINDAVTKGLNLNAPMKESGIEWIGEIPEHWETKKLKYAVNKIGDIDHYMPNSVANGKPYLMTGDIFEQASQIDFFNCKQISEKDFTRLSKKIKPTMGDLIFARYATIGTACYVDIEKDFLVSYSCVTIKPNQRKIIGKYLFYFLKSNVFAEEVKRYINSNTQGNVGIESLHRIRLVVPPLFEQSQIVAFIDEQTTKIDRAIDLQQTYIDKLKEYKSTLIDSVVTGKVRVAS